MTSSEQDKIWLLKPSAVASDLVYQAGRTQHIVYNDLL